MFEKEFEEEPKEQKLWTKACADGVGARSSFKDWKVNGFSVGDFLNGHHATSQSSGVRVLFNQHSSSAIIHLKHGNSWIPVQEVHRDGSVETHSSKGITFSPEQLIQSIKMIKRLQTLLEKHSPKTS